MFRLVARGLLGALVVAIVLGGMFWVMRPVPPAAGDSVIVPASTPPSDLHGAITVWSWNIAAKSLKSIVPAFNRRCPGVGVNVDMTGARMQTRLLLSLASGVGAPDVSQFELTDAPRYIATGRLTDLTPVAMKYRSQFPAYLWDNCMRDGKVYAIPWDMGPCAIFYKRDLFARYGIDADRIETWDDFIAAGKEILRKSHGRTKMLPLSSSGVRGMLEMILHQTGGQVFDAQGRVAIDSPRVRKALDVIRRMRAAGICSDVAGWSQEFLAGLNDDSIATYPNAVWFAGTMEDTVKDFGDKAARWGVMRLPAVEHGGSRVSNLGGSVLVIPAQSKNKAAAWAFIEYALCTREGQVAQYRNFSLFPAYLPALQSPEIQAPDPFFGGQRSGKLFATDVASISRLYISPDWTEAMGYLDQSLSKWASGGMQTDGFFEDLAQRMHTRIGVPLAPAVERGAAQ